MQPRITVVTPSFNQGRYLEETLRSVLSQREHIHEYFVVDGGSTDNSVDLIRRYAPHGIDWWVSEKDRGQTDAIIKGFAKATGDVFCWINSDDLYLPGAIERARRAFEAHPDWDILTGYHVRIDSDSRIVGCYRTPRETRAKFRWGVMRIAQQTTFFKRSGYEAAGGLDMTRHYDMDNDLWFRMMSRGMRFGHIPAYLAAFRWHSEAKSTAAANEMAAETDARLRALYPHFLPGWRSRTGTLFYRLNQLITLCRPRAWLDLCRWRGRQVSAVFGESKVAADSSDPAA